MITFSRARATCPHCGREFNQIDGTPERAMSIVTEARDRHVRSEHPEAVRS